MIRYNIAVLKGDTDQMDRIVALAKGNSWSGTPSGEPRGSRSGSFRPAHTGRARSSSRAMDLALQAGEREVAASYQAARAVWEAVCGNAAEAKRNAMAALANFRTAGMSNTPPALPWLFRETSSRSEALAGDLEKRFPEDTFAKFTYVPVLRALPHWSAGKPADSVERLQIALRYELARERPQLQSFLSWRFALGLCARRGVGCRAPVCGSGGRVSEDPRSSRSCRRGSHRRAGALATR